jgi:hypothetical protein
LCPSYLRLWVLLWCKKKKDQAGHKKAGHLQPAAASASRHKKVTRQQKTKLAEINQSGKAPWLVSLYGLALHIGWNPACSMSRVPLLAVSSMRQDTQSWLPLLCRFQQQLCTYWCSLRKGEKKIFILDESQAFTMPSHGWVKIKILPHCDHTFMVMLNYFRLKADGSLFPFLFSFFAGRKGKWFSDKTCALALDSNIFSEMDWLY